MQLPFIFNTLYSNIIGKSLLALSVLMIASVIALFLSMSLRRTKFYIREDVVFNVIRYITTVSPTVGLLGTIYGLITGLMATSKDQLPHFIGVALTTTFLGSILFLIGFSILTVENFFSSEDKQAPKC